MPYLTITEYLDRYGERETVLITNEAPGGGGYDSAKVQEALDDSQATVDAAISTRYVVPISDPPRIVKGWVAVLAREQLYVRGAPQKVVDDANAVRAALKDLANRKINLPIAEGDDPPVASSSGDPVRSNDAPCPTFDSYKQWDYMSAFNGGNYVANWRRGG